MISIALCTYNGEHYIKEQLESIINQTLPPDEIIICDDCSKDNTKAEIKSVLGHWNGSWEFIENDKNLGFKKNFQKAISLCNGDIIFLSDQDDVWLSDKIEKMVKIFKSDPNCILAFHDVKIVDSNLKEIRPSFWNMLNFNPQPFFKMDYSILLMKNVIQGSACAFRKKLFIHANPFPDDVLHDYWLALVAAASGEKICPVNEKLALYRQSGHNAIGAKEDLSLREKLLGWTSSFTFKIKVHFENIKRDDYIFDKLNSLYSCKGLLAGIRINSFSNFLDNRLTYIENGKFFFLLDIGSYFKYYANKSYALKNYLKDVLAVFTYSRICKR